MRAWRKIHAIILESEQVALLSDGAVVLLTFLIAAQDDDGYYPWTPTKIRRLTISRPNWTPEEINIFVNEIVEAGIAKWEGAGILLINGQKLNGRLRSDVPLFHYQRDNDEALSTGRIRPVDGVDTKEAKDQESRESKADTLRIRPVYAPDTESIHREEESRLNKTKIRPEEEKPLPPGLSGAGGVGNHDADFYGELPKPSNIMVLYEAEVGLLTPLIAEELEDAEKLYPAQWVEDAFREAVELNKRSWRYIEAILKRWAREGKDNGRTQGNHAKRGGDSRRDQGRYNPEDDPYASITTVVNVDAPDDD